MDNTFYFKDKLKVNALDFKDKNVLVQLKVKEMLNRTYKMFEWKGLPNTIPQRVLETQLQVNGSSTIFEFEDKLYACFGQVGGELNYNYLPCLSIVSNPYIPNFNSKTMKIYYGEDTGEIRTKTDFDCVVIPNDIFYMGLVPLCQWYASQQTETVLTRRTILINMRAMNIFLASDDNVKKDFESFMKKLEIGEFAAIMGKNFMAESKTLPFMGSITQSTLTQLTETEQYIKASWFNELGLQANYNMKRESINSNESQLNQDALLPFVDTMLEMRQNHAKLVNEKFGYDISVEFSSAWKYTRDEIEQAIDAIDETSDMKMTENEEVQQVEQNEEKEN